MSDQSAPTVRIPPVAEPEPVGTPSMASDLPSPLGEGPGVRANVGDAGETPIEQLLIAKIEQLQADNADLQLQLSAAQLTQEIWRQTVVDAITNGMDSMSQPAVGPASMPSVLPSLRSGEGGVGSLPSLRSGEGSGVGLGTYHSEIYDFIQESELAKYNAQLNELRRKGWPIHTECPLSTGAMDGALYKLTWLELPDVAELPVAEAPAAVINQPIIQAVHEIPFAPSADIAELMKVG